MTDELVELVRTQTLVEAQLLRAAIQAHGLMALLPEEGIASTFGGGMVTRGVRVLVPAHQRQQIERLLAELAAANG